MGLGDLRTSQLLWLTITLAVFGLADALSRRSGRHPLSHPVLTTTPVVIAIVHATGIGYATYAGATAVLGFLLGPAVVGLAVPIHARLALIRQLALPITLALLAGSATAIGSAVGIMWLFTAPRDVLVSTAWACTIRGRAALRSACRRMVSVRRARLKSAKRWAPLPAWAWRSTR